MFKSRLGKKERKGMILSDVYYLVKHWLIRNREICPKCKKKGFLHGFFPNQEYYCIYCHLWEPEQEIVRKSRKKISERNVEAVTSRQTYKKDATRRLPSK